MSRILHAGLRCAACLTAAAFIAFTIGCDEESEYGLVFSHYNHLEEYDLVCSDCHMASEDGALIPPGHDTCIDCHDDWIEADVGKYTCGSCHVVKDLDEFADQEVPEIEAPSPGVFVHTEALDGMCAECHGKLIDEELERVPEMKRSDIVRMRDMAHESGMECTACHIDMDPDFAPESHNVNWLRRHGEWGQQLDNACSVCHTEQSCADCHEEVMPQSHNNIWRVKTHGIEAAWDMERCSVCHLKESCDECHQEVQPLSHSAGWERRHCTQCHFSQADGTGCVLCHEGGLDSHPSPHPAGYERNHCRSCHDGSPESELCSICHEVNNLGEHPNPHPGGYLRSHCDQCHQGQIDGVSCAACHGGSYADNHVDPHPGNYRNTHCNSCHNDQQAEGSCAICHGWNSLDEHPNPHSAGYVNSHCNSCHAGAQSAEECGPCHEGAGSVLVHEDFWPPVHDRFGEAGNCYDCHY